MAGPETTVLARMSRPIIPVSTNNRLVASPAPTDRVRGVKPSPEHSFAMIDASRGEHRRPALERGFEAPRGRLGAWIVASGCAGAVVHRFWHGGDLTTHRGGFDSAVSPSMAPNDGRLRQQSTGRDGR